jgi:DNA-3-methyladenine glycosylase II
MKRIGKDTEALGTNQQLSKAAADSIMKRLVAVAGNRHLTAESFQAVSDKALKTAGISARRIAHAETELPSEGGLALRSLGEGEYLRDLADKVLSGQLDFHRLPRLSDEEVIRELTQVKGIGRWTAEMYLIFVLCRPDVLPLDDTALRSSIADHVGVKVRGGEGHSGRR